MAGSLDDAGLSARIVADQLGRARPSITQDVYLARNTVDARAAAALDGAFDLPGTAQETWVNRGWSGPEPGLGS